MTSDLVVVSPDAGRLPLATHCAQCLKTSVIVLHKRRESAAETAVTHVVGDVAGRACLIVDDIISTGGTVAASVAALLRAGARPEIIVAATHGLLLPGSRDKLHHPAVCGCSSPIRSLGPAASGRTCAPCRSHPLSLAPCGGSSPTARSATSTEERTYDGAALS